MAKDKVAPIADLPVLAAERAGSTLSEPSITHHLLPDAVRVTSLFAAHQSPIARHIGGEDGAKAAPSAHVVSAAANRRPDR
jgi:hypothetical protein